MVRDPVSIASRILSGASALLRFAAIFVGLAEVARAQEPAFAISACTSGTVNGATCAACVTVGPCLNGSGKSSCASGTSCTGCLCNIPTLGSPCVCSLSRR